MATLVALAKTITAQSVIERAYNLMGYKAAGEPISGDDATYALDALNSMIDSWNTQRLFIVSIADVVGIVTGATANVGAGMAFDIARPIKLEQGAFLRVNGVDFPIEQIDRLTYTSITQKTAASIYPQYVYNDNTLPTAVANFFPAPSNAIEIHLPFQAQIAEFVDLLTEYSFAPGYRRALEYSLAEELSPGVKEISPLIARNAANARRAIRRTNVEVPMLDAMPLSTRYNIISGQ